MRSLVLCLVIGTAACGGTNSSDEAKGDQPASRPRLELTALEMTAKATLDKRDRETREVRLLEDKVKSAMEIALIDPFSAQYRALRGGKNGAVCGQVNGKNRLAAYVGFKDFVLAKDGKTVYFSKQSDGIETEWYSSFSEAFLGACASKTQVARYKAMTEPEPYRPTYDDALAAAAAAAEDAAAAAADAADNVEMPAEEAMPSD